MSYRYLSDNPVEICIRAECGNFYASKNDLIFDGCRIFIITDEGKTEIQEDDIYEI